MIHLVIKFDLSQSRADLQNSQLYVDALYQYYVVFKITHPLIFVGFCSTTTKTSWSKHCRVTRVMAERLAIMLKRKKI